MARNHSPYERRWVQMEFRDWSLDPKWDYVRSDYLTEREQESEADVPVPTSLLSEAKLKLILGCLKRSQKIGLLAWMSSKGLLSLGGRERLLFLQAGASEEALVSAEKFATRVNESEKLQKDFLHAMRGLNKRPRSATFRRMQKRRIGVGYRDKGTLPGFSNSARQAALRDGFVSLEALPDYTQRAIMSILPFSLTEDGSHVDLQIMSQALKPAWALPEVWIQSH